MRKRSGSQGVKWIIDRVAALVLAVVSTPVMAVIGVAILIEDGPPILFVQQRAGRGGRPFRMLKFRSMVRDAIAQHAIVTEDPFGVVRDDPRITSTGRFLRRTGLDEIPQLFNVLAGQMSFVGPRPDLLEQVANYTPQDRGRLAVRPGITGLAQVRGREEIGWPDRIALDVWYIEHWSLWLDAKIVLLTVGQLFRSEPDPVPDSMNVDRARERRDRHP
jgi:lipopolysaccharide/colanic/teichoic acid biosynthesis glycosyltransferase